MEIEPPPPAAEPTRQANKLPAPVSRGVVFACIGYFLGWPVVFLACLPFVTPDNTLPAVLLGAGSLLWLMACFGVVGLLLRLVEAYNWQNTPQRIRTPRTIAVASWFFGWFPLFHAYSHFTASWIEEHHSWINIFIFVLGTIFWLMSSYWIYDMLFTMAETRWPAARAIRNAIRELAYFLFRFLRTFRPQ